jgi:hypothetical protein
MLDSFRPVSYPAGEHPFESTEMPSRRSQGGERQVRLRPQYAHLYKDIPPNEWWPAWLMAEKLLAQAEARGVPPQQRICDPSHFLFRGGEPRGPRLQDLRTRRSDVGP